MIDFSSLWTSLSRSWSTSRACEQVYHGRDRLFEFLNKSITIMIDLWVCEQVDHDRDRLFEFVNKSVTIMIGFWVCEQVGHDHDRLLSLWTSRSRSWSTFEFVSTHSITDRDQCLNKSDQKVWTHNTAIINSVDVSHVFCTYPYHDKSECYLSW